MTEEAPKPGRWTKGMASPNPGGRPKGAGWHATMRLKLRTAFEPVLGALFKAALAGDTAAAKLLLERALPPLRDDPVSLPAGGDLASRALSIMDGIAEGRLTPNQGSPPRAVRSASPDIVRKGR